MKKCKLISILTLMALGVLPAFATEGVPPPVQEEEQTEGVWSLFVKKFGSEKLLVKFPENFEIEYLKDTNGMQVFSSEEDATYYFSAFPISEKKNQIEETLANLKKAKEVTILNISESKTNQGKVVDVEYLDSQISGDGLEMNFKIRFIETKENIYTLSTMEKYGRDDKHSYFISSFIIE